jgi:7-carboxy-7-deazaguanine synthase
MSDTLVVSEVFLSVQGESTFAGLPCVFVRLTGCNLRCSYCDTAYAFRGGRVWTLAGVRGEVERFAAPFGGAGAGAGRGRLPLVEVTGGEPLLQRGVLALMSGLCDAGFTVLLETSGALDIAPVDTRVRRVMDLKCPSSGESARNHWDNIAHLRSGDEVKFVIGTREDYDWAREQLARHRLAERCPVLFSWASPLSPPQRDLSLRPAPEGHRPLARQELVEAILADALPVRFQLQLHKHIWPPERRGV